MTQPQKQKEDRGMETQHKTRSAGPNQHGPAALIRDPDLGALQCAMRDPTRAAARDILTMERRYGNGAVHRLLAQAAGLQENRVEDKEVKTEPEHKLPPRWRFPRQYDILRIPPGEVLQRSNGMEQRRRQAIREMRKTRERELPPKRVHAGEEEPNPALVTIPPVQPDDTWKKTDYFLWVLKPGTGPFGHYIAVGQEAGDFAPEPGKRRGHPSVAIEQHQARQMFKAKIGGELYWLQWLDGGRGSWVMDNNSGRFGAIVGDLEQTKSVLIGAAKVFKDATNQDVQIGKVSRNAVRRWFQTRFRRPWQYFRFRRFYEIGEITHQDRQAAFEVIEST